MKNQQKNSNAFLKFFWWFILIVWNQHFQQHCPSLVRNFRQAHGSYEPEATTSWKVPWLLFYMYFSKCRWEIHATMFFLILKYIDQTEYVLKFEVGFLVLVIPSCSWTNFF